MSTLEAGRSLVVILDDDAEFNKLVTHVLKKMGLAAQSFVEADPFLDRVQKSLPALCLVDLNLGNHLSGLRVIDVLRRDVHYKGPVFVISGDERPETIAHAIELGATDYLVKPMEPSVLIEKLKRLFESKELKAQSADMPYEFAQGLEKGVARLGFELREVDECGIKIATPHLPAKGMRIELDGPAMIELFGLERPPLTVSSTWVEPRGGYGAYLELDASDEKSSEKLKAWIRRQPR